jgi:hypothetical protein
MDASAPHATSDFRDWTDMLATPRSAPFLNATPRMLYGGSPSLMNPPVPPRSRRRKCTHRPPPAVLFSASSPLTSATLASTPPPCSPPQPHLPPHHNAAPARHHLLHARQEMTAPHWRHRSHRHNQSHHSRQRARDARLQLQRLLRRIIV